MKQISCFLLLTIICIQATQACDPAKTCAKQQIDTAKKVSVKATPAAQPPKKQTSKKEEKKTESDIVSPLSWRPTLLY